MRRERYLGALANAIARWPLAFIVAGVVLAASSGIYAWRFLDFKTSRNDLIGRDSEYWRLYSEYAREFHAEEDYLVVVEGAKPERNRAALDALVKELLAPGNNPSPVPVHMPLHSVVIRINPVQHPQAIVAHAFKH